MLSVRPVEKSGEEKFGRPRICKIRCDGRMMAQRGHEPALLGDRAKPTGAGSAVNKQKIKIQSTSKVLPPLLRPMRRSTEASGHRAPIPV
jgi:hypothetical protein